MGNGGNGTTGQQQRQDGLDALLRAAAYEAWAARREDEQDRSQAFFDRAYLGHYACIDHYVEQLVDRYELDAKLDAAIALPFREFVDIDITGLARSLVRSKTLYALSAIPVGVWVFNGEIE